MTKIQSIQNINAKAHPKDEVAQQLSKAFGGVTIVQKGSEDYIANADQGNFCIFFFFFYIQKDIETFIVLKCDAEGGLKRMGGQGDILTGIIAAFLAWGKGYEDEVWEYVCFFYVFHILTNI